jgi:hypothetical protein
MKTRIGLIFMFLALFSSALFAAGEKSEGQFEAGVFVQSDAEGAPPLIGLPPEGAAYVFHGAAPGRPVGDVTFAFVASELTGGGKTVKGAPYSAEAVTETVQTLSDGNRITHKNTAQISRDSEGRTRRDQSLGVGLLGSTGESSQRAFIFDPVGGFHYVLNPQEHTFRKMPIPSSDSGVQTVGISKTADGTAPRGGRVLMRRFEHGQAALEPGNAQQEPLGKQMIEGIQVEGTRSTLTIEAGKIGNELPIQIVSERWYSPDLQVVVMSKHSDPRVGETVYRLTNIVRSEPSPTLFEVPADYKVDESPAHTFRMKTKSSIP